MSKHVCQPVLMPRRPVRRLLRLLVLGALLSAASHGEAAATGSEENEIMRANGSFEVEMKPRSPAKDLSIDIRPIFAPAAWL